MSSAWLPSLLQHVGLTTSSSEIPTKLNRDLLRNVQPFRDHYSIPSIEIDGDNTNSTSTAGVLPLKPRKSKSKPTLIKPTIYPQNIVLQILNRFPYYLYVQLRSTMSVPITTRDPFTFTITAPEPELEPKPELNDDAAAAADEMKVEAVAAAVSSAKQPGPCSSKQLICTEFRKQLLDCFGTSSRKRCVDTLFEELVLTAQKSYAG
jgi:hypothetical protein